MGPLGSLTQVIKVNNPQKAALRMRIKVRSRTLVFHSLSFVFQSKLHLKPSGARRPLKSTLPLRGSGSSWTTGARRRSLVTRQQCGWHRCTLNRILRPPSQVKSSETWPTSNLNLPMFSLPPELPLQPSKSGIDLTLLECRLQDPKCVGTFEKMCTIVWKMCISFKQNIHGR